MDKLTKKPSYTEESQKRTTKKDKTTVWEILEYEKSLLMNFKYIDYQPNEQYHASKPKTLSLR